MEFDTSATLASISIKYYKKLYINEKLFNMKLRTRTGEVFKPAGVTYVKRRYESQPFYGKLYIINKDVDPILGRSWMREFNIKLAKMRTVQACEKTPKREKCLE